MDSATVNHSNMRFQEIVDELNKFMENSKIQMSHEFVPSMKFP